MRQFGRRTGQLPIKGNLLPEMGKSSANGDTVASNGGNSASVPAG